MRIVVTGGAGFIGHHLCRNFLGRGDEVVCIDNFISSERGRIRPLQDEGKERFVFIEHNVCAHIKVDGVVDAVFHFASPASPIDYLNYPIQTLKVGALGTHNALGLALTKKARFLLASTSEVYGDPEIHPQSEDYWGNVNPIGPRGVYDEAKRFAEALTMAYHRTHGLQTYIARLFNTYGPGMRLEDGRAIPNFLRAAIRGEPLPVYGDGSQTRSFCYISDLVEGLIALSKSEVHDPVNLGNPAEMTIAELAEQVLKITGSGSCIEQRPLPQDDPKIRQPDIAKARALLGWEPKISVEEGLHQTAEDFQKRLSIGQK
ncbi:MAG: SDR family oxidoreductase [bacterium]|nr:SDR family oxidoreductase [bacterium]